MVDSLSSSARSARMASIKGKNTKPEMIVRRLIHGLGYRYRLHDERLPGRPDLVFPNRRKVIFVHGCFWHRHDDPACKLARLPKSRLDFWLPKLDANVKRDSVKKQQLGAAGWSVSEIWECQINDLATLEMRVREFLE